MQPVVCERWWQMYVRQPLSNVLHGHASTAGKRLIDLRNHQQFHCDEFLFLSDETARRGQLAAGCNGKLFGNIDAV
jgi:hypothetical protein